MTVPRVTLTPGCSITAIVLSRNQEPPSHVTRFALVVGLAVHVGVGWASAALPSPRPALAVAAAAPLHVSLGHAVPLAPPAPPTPPPAEPRVEPPRPPPRRTAATPPPAPAEPAPAPPAQAEEPPEAIAQAAEVVQAPASAAQPPVDFAMVAGASAVHAGGATANTGLSASTVHAAALGGVPGRVGAGSSAPSPRARPVGQPTRAWRCDWPDAASGLDVDVEFVNLRVAVESSGQITDVRVIRHAGYGFDVEARRCALRHTLPPARDASGTPVRTPSHPIRLRFER